jgi:hypothetical protein
MTVAMSNPIRIGVCLVVAGGARVRRVCFGGAVP